MVLWQLPPIIAMHWPIAQKILLLSMQFLFQSDTEAGLGLK